MRIAIGGDHHAFGLKAKVCTFLEKLGHEVIDVGSDSEEPVDYPEIASPVAEMVSEGKVDRGILICGTGVGMCIVANKFPGVRAAPCMDDLTAELSRRHNDLNILCLSADLLGERLVDRMVDLWLKTPFEGGRHERRKGQITRIEQRTICSPREAGETPGE